MSKKEIVRFKMRYGSSMSKAEIVRFKRYYRECYKRYYKRKVAFHNLRLWDDFSLSAKAAKENYLWRKQCVESRNKQDGSM